jgi:hypothetical protein
LHLELRILDTRAQQRSLHDTRGCRDEQPGSGCASESGRHARVGVDGREVHGMQIGLQRAGGDDESEARGGERSQIQTVYFFHMDFTLFIGFVSLFLRFLLFD